MRGHSITPAFLCGALLLAGVPSARAESFSARLESARKAILQRAKAMTAGAEKEDDGSAALPLKDGTWRVNIHWDFDPEDGESVLAAHLAFFPDPKRAPACRSIRIIQAAQMETAPDRQYQWPSLSGEADRNLTRAPDGFYVDHKAADCSRGKPCSPYYRDSWSLPKESQDGSNLPGRAEPSSTADYPFGWDQFDRIKLEACARCVDDGSFLGCVQWGAFWPRIGSRPPPFTPAASDAPSPSFLEALRIFNAFYANNPR